MVEALCFFKLLKLFTLAQKMLDLKGYLELLCNSFKKKNLEIIMKFWARLGFLYVWWDFNFGLVGKEKCGFPFIL